jgi:hypothetical protein
MSQLLSRSPAAQCESTEVNEFIAELSIVLFEAMALDTSGTMVRRSACGFAECSVLETV